MTKKAIITGIAGQDGAYLAKLLLEKGYRVLGGDRRSSRQSTRLDYMGIADDVERVDFELSEFTNIARLIQNEQPDEVYNLAAQSFVGTSWEQPLTTTDVNANGVLRLLEAIRTFSPHTRFYQASTSEMFGAIEAPQRESTPFYPRSPYGVSKLFAHWITKNYRESFDLKASSGILFNHESPLRGREFVTRKISLAMSRIALGEQDVLELGNLGAQRDWGFAGDYVEGMWRIINAEPRDDYVLATGETHTIREFAELAGAQLGMELAWEGEGVDEKGIDTKTGKTIVQVNPKFFRPAEVDLLLGDASRAESELGWERKVSFPQLVEMMVREDYDLLKAGRLNH
ncbi:GDP-mannose 4,6-dehydratase [Erythrobacter sp. SN021]|uniref:GDP-mannose 4,6-dehydratase n=1 Tax=Erythrobacter sp. SN021 TaxID=2912574 RepID=UPI000C653CEF|nr:GDP-mannose 4,6-dehydratase [Erythrobacter sp. SN021]MBL43778.1 GDP-mannose 4,6-dehydratase [Sphingomonadaceae bacterium]MCF8881612.1 GDP-mannose 4,6-dehydratase [Erythrobacter sp. SN021]